MKKYLPLAATAVIFVASLIILSTPLRPQITSVTPELNLTPTQGEWKTYKNDEFGFEFKYPSKYELLIETENLIRPGNEWQIRLRDPIIQEYNDKNEMREFKNPDLFVLSLVGDFKYDSDSKSEIKPIRLGSNEFESFFATKYEMTDVYYYRIGDYLFTNIHTNWHELNPDFDQILSSFKFTQ